MALNFSYGSGLVFQEGIQGFFIPLNTFLLILHKISSCENNDSIQNILRNAFTKDALFLEYESRKNKSFASKLNFFLTRISSLGMGNFRLLYVKKKKILILQDQLILTPYYEGLFQKKLNFNLENFFITFIANFLSSHFQKEVEVSMIKKSGQIIYSCVLSEKNFCRPVNTNFYPRRVSNPVNRVIRNVAVNDHIKVKQGSIKIWGVYAVFLPAHFLFSLLSYTSYNYSTFFADLGYVQGNWAVNIQKDQFGIRNSNKLFLQILNQSELVGYGLIQSYSDSNYRKLDLQGNFLSYFGLFYDFRVIMFWLNYIFYNFKGGFDFSYEISTNLEIAGLNCVLEPFEEKPESDLDFSLILNSRALPF